MHVSDAQPATLLPVMATITDQTIPIKLKSATKNQNVVIMRIGFTDRLVIPSKASDSIFFNG